MFESLSIDIADTINLTELKKTSMKLTQLNYNIFNQLHNLKFIKQHTNYNLNFLEDIDIVEEISERTGRNLDGAENNRFYGKANIVENLVYFFNEQPKNET